MTYIPLPNLPQGRVCACIVGDKTIGAALLALGIDVISVSECDDVAPPLRLHADMLFHHLGGNEIIAYHTQALEIARLTEMGFDVHIMRGELRPEYPHDVALNAAFVGRNLICNRVHTYDKIVSVGGENIIDVRQGYAKCSTLIVDENSIITADSGIYNAVVAHGLSALKISAGGIELVGYDSGFIGGCAAKLSRNEIFFTGNVLSHCDGKRIVSFIESRGINIVCANRQKLVDIGSLIPLTENIAI